MTSFTDGSTDPVVEYDPRSGVYHTWYDWSQPTPIDTFLAEAVAAVASCDPRDLEPLNTHIDPDALDALFRRRFDGTYRQGGRVSFSFADHDVTIYSDGYIEIQSPVPSNVEGIER